MRRLTLASLVLSLFALTACKSGVGERCQVDSDCEEGLVCGQRTNTCQTEFESEFDASVDAAQDGPIDAPDDAAPDAAVDAMPDA